MEDSGWLGLSTKGFSILGLHFLNVISTECSMLCPITCEKNYRLLGQDSKPGLLLSCADVLTT